MIWCDKSQKEILVATLVMIGIVVVVPLFINLGDSPYGFDRAIFFVEMLQLAVKCLSGRKK
jgi:hypothetical protein